MLMILIFSCKDGNDIQTACRLVTIFAILQAFLSFHKNVNALFYGIIYPPVTLVNLCSDEHLL